MSNTVNDRIIALLKTKGWDEIKVASLIGKDKTTLYRITAKEVVPQKNTVKLIAEVCGVDFGELYYGEKVNSPATEKSSISEALSLLKEQLKEKDEQIRTLLGIISGKPGAAASNFLKPLTGTSSARIIRLFPELLRVTA